MAGQGDLIPKKKLRAEEAERPWADLLPTDVLHRVALRLPPRDLSSFRKVCRIWRSLPIESYPLGRSPLFLSKEGYLFHTKHPLEDHKLLLYNPLYNMTLSWAASHEVLDIFNNLSTTHIMHSKDGWVICCEISSGEPVFVFIDPFLRSTTAAAIIRWRVPLKYHSFMPLECRSLVPLNYVQRSVSVSMNAPPTDPACILLIAGSHNDGIWVILGTEGGTNWKDDSFLHGGLDDDFRGTPVFCRGVFYFLMRSGCLVVYDPHLRTWNEHHMEFAMDMHSVLVESDGELLNVYEFRVDDAPYGDPLDPLVLRLNESSMEWEELTELGGRALFLDWKGGISAVAEVDGMKDRIFFSRFQYLRNAGKPNCELHRSAGGEPRLVPMPGAGFAKLARRAEGKIAGMSIPYPSSGPGKKAKVRSAEYMPISGSWVQPNWGK